MSIVVMDPSGRALRQTDDWDADIAYGEDENRFTITRIAGPPLEAHSRWQVDGTPYAGIVDSVCPSTDDGGGSSVSYKGRTAQGVLAEKVIMPPSGQAHRTASGDLNECIAEVIGLCGLEGYARAAEGESGISVEGYQYHRFVNAYDGLRMLCASAGARLLFRATGTGLEVSAVPATEYGDIPSELVSFSAQRDYRPVNHMVGLGSGQGTSRQVVHWYAGADGSLSQTQMLFGVDERAQTYDFASSQDLSGDTREKLSELQGQGTFDASIPDGALLDVGDTVTASDAATGIGVEAQVTKVICKVSLGEPAVSYETGSPEWPEEEE